MKAEVLIGISRDLAKHFGEFAGRLSPNGIHLEKTVLAVRKSHRKCEIFAVARAYHRNAGCVSLDSGASAEPGDRYLAVQLGKARSQPQPAGQEQ